MTFLRFFSMFGACALRAGRRRYCTAALALVLAGPAARQASAQVEPVPGEATFTILIRGTDVGREQVNLTRSERFVELLAAAYGCLAGDQRRL